MCRMKLRLGLPPYVSGAAMIPEEVKPYDPAPSAEREETQPRNWPGGSPG